MAGLFVAELFLASGLDTLQVWSIDIVRPFLFGGLPVMDLLLKLSDTLQKRDHYLPVRHLVALEP